MTARTFTFQVSAPTAPTGSVLSSITAELQAASPSAPMWSVELPTASSRFLAQSHPSRPSDATTINQAIGTNGEASGPNRAFRGWNPSSTQVLTGAGGPYSSHWDSTTGEWWLSYGTTGWNPWSQVVIRYQSSRDEFRHWQASSEGASDGLWHPYGQAHNFGMSCLDPVGRKFYRTLRPQTWAATQPNGEFAPQGSYKLCWIDMDNPSSNRGTVPGWVTGHGTHLPIEFFPELNSVVFFRFNPDTTQPLFRFDVGSQQYVYDLPSVLTGRRPVLSYCNGAIYWVSNNACWRLNADKTLTSLGAPPVEMNGNGNSPTPSDLKHTEFAALGTKIYAFRCGDMSTGGNGDVYEWNVLTNVWTRVDDLPHRLIPEYTAGYTAFAPIAHSVAPVPELGVIVCALRLTDNTDCAFVWKPPT